MRHGSNRVCFILCIALALVWATCEGADGLLQGQLVTAVRKGNTDEIERLIGQGADAKQFNILIAAVTANQTLAVRTLLAHRANPNAWSLGLSPSSFMGGPTGSPIYLAAKKSNREMLKTLKEYGANFDAEISTDTSIISTPLISAIYYGELDAARLLLEYGANVNQVSRRGNTALHQAIRSSAGKSVECVKLLLQYHADPDIKDAQGTTARGLAYESNNSEIIALIQKAKPATSTQKLPNIPAEEFLNIQMTVLTKGICDSQLPGYRQETTTLFNRWRQPRAALVEQIENSPQYRLAIEQSKQRSSPETRNAAQQQAQMQELEATCRGELLEELAKVSNTGPDRAFATPEKTWNRYVSALRAGDRQIAISCLTSTARDNYRSVLQQATAEQLRSMADAVKTFSLTNARFGNEAEAAVSLTNGHGGLIYFQNVNNEWKISEM